MGPLPQPPSEVLDVSLSGDVPRQNFVLDVRYLQELASSRFTAASGLGPGFWFLNQLNTDISENSITPGGDIIAGTGLSISRQKLS